MIATLTGKLKTKLNNQIVINVNGIGYCLHVSKNTLDNIGEVDESVILNTDLQVRDDSILLFGFKFQNELNMFKLLQSIQGIGPRAALAVLSALTVEEIIVAIKSSDKSAFQKADGIGQRVATRIVSELQEKIDQFSLTNSNIKSKDLKKGPIDWKTFERLIPTCALEDITVWHEGMSEWLLLEEIRDIIITD